MAWGIGRWDDSELDGGEQFDEEARRSLGMGGDEFMQRWEAGQWEPEEDPEVDHVLSRSPSLR
jgi:hypothetical protein